MDIERMRSRLWQPAGFFLLLVLGGCGFADSEQPAEAGATMSDLTISTYSETVSGVAGAERRPLPVALKLTIAPMLNGSVSLTQALDVVSNSNGKLNISLAPGRYWVGARQQLEDPQQYGLSTSVIDAQVVELVPGQQTHIDVYNRGYAP